MEPHFEAMDIITGSSNPAIKRIRALQARKQRDASRTFFAEGIRIVGEAVETGASIETLVVAPDLLTSEYGHDLVRRSGSAGTPVLTVSGDVFRGLSGKDGPQGLGGVVRQRWSRLKEVDPGAGLCWIALDKVADPGNLGTIVRTADAVGAAGIILVGPSADPYEPTALRGSMGAIFSQQLVRTEWNDLTVWIRESGSSLVGTSDAAALDYREAEYGHPLVLLMGSEREGLSMEQQEACDLLVRIPMVGRSDSLNLAVATGIILYAVHNRRFPASRGMGPAKG